MRMTLSNGDIKYDEPAHSAMRCKLGFGGFDWSRALVRGACAGFSSVDITFGEPAERTPCTSVRRSG